MSTKYKATANGEAYFVTITTVGWIDVFTRLNQKYILINALKYCQKERGLEIYGYCIMSSHMHLGVVLAVLAFHLFEKKIRVI